MGAHESTPSAFVFLNATANSVPCDTSTFSPVSSSTGSFGAVMTSFATIEAPFFHIQLSEVSVPAGSTK